MDMEEGRAAIHNLDLAAARAASLLLVCATPWAFSGWYIALVHQGEKTASARASAEETGGEVETETSDNFELSLPPLLNPEIQMRARNHRELTLAV